MTSSGGASDVLKVKPPTAPRKLQPWQAYHALTYHSHWKPHVDAAWAEYTKAWALEHPDEKPGKGRFQIMVEFMKTKFNEETDEMKARCEEYRNPEKREELNPKPGKSQSTINTNYQA